MNKKIILCAAAALAAVCTFGQGASRTMCLGDSITHFGYTEYYLQLFENLRHPGSGVRYYNAGYSGATVGGGRANYAHEHGRIRPDRVSVMFGMNDVLWTTFETNATLSAQRETAVDGALARYGRDYRGLVDQIRASGVSNIVLVTPSPYDEYSVKLGSERKRNVNTYGLTRAAQIVREVAAEKGVPVVDVHASMTALCEKYPDRGLCGGDRVHPPRLGHLFMAFQYLAGATNPVAETVLDAKGAVLKQANAAVGNVRASADALSFDYAPKALPFPVLEEYTVLKRLWPEAARFNRETLSVAGLPANSRWTLKADGRALGEFGAEELAAGVNLAELDTPNARVAAQAAKTMEALHDFDRPRRDRACLRRNFEALGVPMTDKAALKAGYEKRLADLKAMKAHWYEWERKASQDFLDAIGREQEIQAEEERLYAALAAVRPSTCRLELVRVVPKAAFDTRAADRVAAGHVCEIGIPWHFPSNRIDWLFNPTKAKPPYNPEWTWQLNRLGGWRVLAEAYETTKDEKYARAFAVQLADWLDQTGAVPPEKGYNNHGSPWRTIEEGLRLMKPFPTAYRAFEHSPSLTDDLRARFLACMRAQARHLMAHRTAKGNWLLMEMDGVYTFACRFPELPESAALRKESAAILSAAIREQVLPDGLHYELSPDYHLVFYFCAAQMLDTAREFGFAHELPADFASILERGADGFVKTMAPGFVQPRFNDCYTIETKRVLETAAKLFPHRKDFLWAASEGRQGEPPAATPTASRFLPYSGFAVMRSSWGRDAAYLAFDVGPLGMGHWHQDKLSFTFWKGDEELVFDDGGGQYEVSDFRTYALSGYDHNTLLVDGLAQMRRDPKAVEGPIDAGWTSTPARDSARGTYDQGFGPKEQKLARHTREIVFEKEQELFRVTDMAVSADGKEHDYELLFHVDTTNVVVASDGRSLVARFGKKWDLALTVEQGGTISLQSGVVQPRLAGWFVGRNNLTVHKATTISVKAPRAKDARFVTTFRPVPTTNPTVPSRLGCAPAPGARPAPHLGCAPAPGARQTVEDVVARRTAAEKARGAGKRGWLAWEAERNQYFPAQNLKRVDEIAAMLPPKAELPGDPVRYRAEWDKLATTPEGQARIQTAVQALAKAIPALTAETYEAYRRTGDRSTYKAQGERNQQLLQLLWGEVLENKGRFTAKIAEVLDAMCAEPSWVAPFEGGASDIPKPLHGIHYIDLTAAARAELVATTLSYLRGKLPEAARAKTLDVLRGRVFETFLADSRRRGEKTPYHCWWMPDRFNWSAVCHNGCVTAILAVEDDPKVRAEAVESAERLMAPCFLDGFLADGYCEEGMGYWNYGFGCFMRLASSVRALTDGRVDWCRAFPKAKSVAAFGSKYLMGRGSSPLFADGNGTPARNVLALVNMNWPDLYAAEVRGLSPFEGGLEICALRNFGRLRHVPPKAGARAELPRRDWFAAAETLICRDGPLSFAIKGGSNGDRHNHDDAGSYLVNLSDREVAGDPGNENYTGRTFSRRRYESKVLNSYAHPVPRVGGCLQGGGPAFGAKLVKTEFSDAKDVVVYDLSGAYPAQVPVVKLLRTATFDRAAHAVTVVDEAEFAAPTAFETPLIAWRKPVMGADRGHFRLDNGAGEKLDVAVEVEGGDWKLGEEFIENPGRTQPYRLAVALKEPVRKVRVSVRYRLLSEDDLKRLSPQMGVLTPPVRPEPRINGPRVFGVRPGHPVLWRIPVTGERPLSVEVKGVPAGAVYDAGLGMVTGTVASAGVYDLAVTAKNAKGTATRTLTLKIGDAICLTPPLGWNSWNCWGQEVSDEKMRRAADAMVSSGLADHGWSYVVVDDCWRTRPTELQAGFKRPGWIADKPHMYGPNRKADGTPETNCWFPDMKAMADYIHAKGLRAGLYSVPSFVACCYTFGSWQHEEVDARTWAKWGYDLVKYDWCYGMRHFDKKGTERDWQIARFKLMGDLLARQDRDMVYNVCQYGRQGVTEWAKGTGAHYWRTNDDLKDTWPLLIKSINENLKVADAAGPDGWNDPDMLVIGPMRSNGFTKSRLTPNEQYTHISLWAIMASPLFIGCDLERLPQDPLALSLLTNDEVIEIDQDELGKVGRPVAHTAEYDVWARPLANGDWAVALFNRTELPRTISAKFADFGASGALTVRDVWTQKDLGRFKESFTQLVYGHATRLFRLRRE